MSLTRLKERIQNISHNLFMPDWGLFERMSLKRENDDKRFLSYFAELCTIALCLRSDNLFIKFFRGKFHESISWFTSFLQSISIRDNPSTSIYFIQLTYYILVMKYLSSPLEKCRERIRKHEKRFFIFEIFFDWTDPQSVM